MDLKRGDIVICSVGGDYGKPRPAVVIQSNLFNPTHASITLCPITSHWVDASLFRLPILPTSENGLKQQSQIMVDKMITLSREKIKQKIGTLSNDIMVGLNKALKLWIDLDACG